MSYIESDEDYSDELTRISYAVRAGATIAIDLETSGLDMHATDITRGISVAWDSGRDIPDAIYLPLSHPDSRNFDHRPLIELLNTHGGTQVFHNAVGVDWIGLEQLGYRLPERYYDTQVGDWLMDENQDHRLKGGLATRLWGHSETEELQHLRAIRAGRPLPDCREQAKAELKERDPKATYKANKTWIDERSKELHDETVRDWDTFTADDIGAYAAKDAELTLRAADWQAENMPKLKHPVLPALKRELDFQRVLHEVIGNGIRVDADRMAAQRDIAIAERDQHTATLHELAGFEINLNSNPQKAKLLYEQWGLEVLERSRKTGEPSTSRRAIEPHAIGHPGVAAILEYQRVEKALTSFYSPLIEKTGRDGRVHTSFSSTRTVTGRLSSSSPNLQTIPKEGTIDGIRQCFIPAGGCELWEYDLAAAELRVISAFSRESSMIDALLEGRDLHGETAASVWGPNYTETERGLGKNMNFTLPYFGGWEPIARYMAAGRGVRITPDIEYAAKRAHDGWHQTYKRVHHLMHFLQDQAKKEGALPLHVPGRYRHFRSPGKQIGYHTALNALVQGGIGELMKDVMSEAVRSVDGKVCLQVHDSLVIEVAPGDGLHVRDQLQGILDVLNPFGIPMRFDPKEWGK